MMAHLSALSHQDFISFLGSVLYPDSVIAGALGVIVIGFSKVYLWGKLC